MISIDNINFIILDMNPLISGRCQLTSCRYCCKTFLNGFYCPMESECGGIGTNRATIIVVSAICGFLFLLLIGFLIFRVCQRKIETQPYDMIKSKVSTPYLPSVYGS